MVFYLGGHHVHPHGICLIEHLWLQTVGHVCRHCRHAYTRPLKLALQTPNHRVLSLNRPVIAPNHRMLAAKGQVLALNHPVTSPNLQVILSTLIRPYPEGRDCARKL